MQAPNSISRREKGYAIIVTTLTMMVIVPLVGLASDLTILYLIKTKLLAATDAAVLAGARALSQGADPIAQRFNAQTAATRFFFANFPNGDWGTRNLVFPTVSVDDTSTPNYRTVTATATVEAPLYFLRIFGGDYSTIGAESQAARRDALVEVVLDRSSSMTGTVPGTGLTACNIMKQDALEFVTHFAPGRDQLGLVVFGASVFSYPSRTNFNMPDASGNTVSSLISQINCYGNTGSAQGLNAAYQELLRVNNPNRVNVIVFMTDGRPNGTTGDFTPYRRAPAICDVAGAPLKGVLAQWAGGAVSTGTTAGLMEYASPQVATPERATTTNSLGCQFVNDRTLIRNDVSSMPPADIYGNALDGPYSYLNMNAPYFGLHTALTGVNSPLQITLASANALDNQASAIRSDSVLRPSIYTIGLKGNGAVTDQPDDLLLKKIANDPSLARDPYPAPTFYANQRNEPSGVYVIAPDATQLQAAFDTIATHIVVRLSR